ncbi:MAG TPA: hypothetical protein PK771_03020 [Spirochaetota bacterium]|mgnify:CR=1 FL=1|nr:hypothetical protein [Spirochaetota bacterium]
MTETNEYRLKKIDDYLLRIKNDFKDEKYSSEINLSLRNIERELESLVVRMER